MNSKITMLKLADVIPTPDNPRRIAKNDPKIKELAESIEKSGLLQPVVCRPHPQQPGKYDLRAGFRRFLAHELIGADEIMAIVRDMDDATAMEITVLENLQREQLMPIEEARGVQALLDTGHNIQQIADDIGKPPAWVYRRASLTKLVPEMVKEVNDDESKWFGASASLLELIARLPAERQKTIRTGHTWVVDRPVSYVERYLAEEEHLLSAASWKLDDPDLGEIPCVKCAKRSDVQPELFFDDTKPETLKKYARCLDPDCWQRKANAYLVNLAGKLHKEHGDNLVVVTGYQSAVKKTHDEWEVDRCKKTAPGARPALISKNGTIETAWVKVKHYADEGVTGKPRRPSLELRRKAWVIEYVAAAMDKQKTAPAMKLDYAAALVSVIGTHNSTRWASRKTSSWDAINALNASGEGGIMQKLWKQVQPILATRLSYQAVVDCEPQYIEALAQAELLGLGNEAALMPLAVNALPDKSAKGGKKKAK